jgi:hypothetical protein
MKPIVPLSIALVAISSCSDEVCACLAFDPPSVVVWGRVTMDSGAAAAGAAIRASVTEASEPCVQGRMEFVGLANSQGRFRLFLRREVPPADSACVFLRAAYPGEAPATRVATLGPFIVTFAKPPVDSVQVDFALEPTTP